MDRRIMSPGLLRILFLGLLVSAQAGCGKSGPTDVQHIRATLVNLGEAAEDEYAFQEFFVSNAAPDDAARQQYLQYSLRIGEAEVAGDSAEVDVELLDSSGASAGTQTWKLARVEGRWRIESAPLP